MTSQSIYQLHTGPIHENSASDCSNLVNQISVSCSTAWLTCKICRSLYRILVMIARLLVGILWLDIFATFKYSMFSTTYTWRIGSFIITWTRTIWWLRSCCAPTPRSWPIKIPVQKSNSEKFVRAVKVTSKKQCFFSVRFVIPMSIFSGFISRSRDVNKVRSLTPIDTGSSESPCTWDAWKGPLKRWKHVPESALLEVVGAIAEGRVENLVG